MKNHNRNAVFDYAKLGLALVAGITADILCTKLVSHEVLHITVYSTVTLLYAFCFDVFDFDKPVNILKIFYIIICPITGGFLAWNGFSFLFSEYCLKKVTRGIKHYGK